MKRVPEADAPRVKWQTVPRLRIVELYLHFPNIFIVCCLINEAWG
jgi:hypothetical protein